MWHLSLPMWWRKLVKWFLYLVIFLAVVLVVIMGPVLGVNPFEGDVDELWDLVSHEVHVFVRFPGGRVLEGEVAEKLAREPGYEELAEFRQVLADAAQQFAEEINPQIPLGLLEFDLREDFLNREMAIGATITDVTSMKLDSFIFLARVPFLGRFVSALKEPFVRNNIAGGDRIEQVKGNYLRIHLPPETVSQLNRFRSIRGRPNDDVIYVGRIGDVVLVSDNDHWIEDALLSGTGRTLKADPYFETEFIATATARDDIEVYLRGDWARIFMTTHTRQDLRPIAAFLPHRIVDTITLRVGEIPGDLIRIDATNRPGKDSFATVPAHIGRIYDAEKTDPRYDLSGDGIGRCIPKKRFVAALALRMGPADLSNVLLSLLTHEDIRDLDEIVRDHRSYGYGTFERMLQKLAGNLGQTHLLVLHRPSEFDQVDYETLEEKPDDPTPQLGFTFVLEVQANLEAAEVVKEITRHLKIFSLKLRSVDKNTGMHKTNTEDLPLMDLELLQPVYGAMPDGMKYIYISSSVEGAAAVRAAAENPSVRLLEDERVAALVRHLPRKATIAYVAKMDGVKRHLLDSVRIWAEERIDEPNIAADLRRQYDKARKTVEDDQIFAEARAQAESDYPRYKRMYEESLAWMDALDTVMGSFTLGSPPFRRAAATAVISFDFPDGETEWRSRPD